MKHAPKQWLAAAVLAACGLAAVAQTAPAPATPGAPHERMGRHDPARMQEHIAKRQAALKQKLALTPAQEGAWTSFTTAMTPPARGARPDRAAFEKLSTPDRIDQMKALRNQRIAEMDRRADATKAFYAALTPDQKKVF
ncbi:MAG: Spy/CpxP family protein refolding chaperone, partial [Ramlibacter sp.]